MSKQSRTYRLTTETIAELDKLANESGISATEAVTRAIHAAARKEYDSNTYNTARKEADAAIKRANELAQELDRTHAALERAQESLKAAQVLQQQASERAERAETELRALPDPNEWKQKSLFDRIMRR